jgi:HAE1 family hydrophobic/amphiphilic exporter-1
VNLSEPFIRRPVMTVVLTASAVVFGVLAYTQLPVNDLPAVDYPVIQVMVGYPGATPETVAANIATPLERQFMQIPGLEMVTSRSGQGSCSMTLQFALSKSIDAAATDVQAAISRAMGGLPVDLPSPPTFSKSNPNDQPILYAALTSDSLTRGQLYDLASTQVGQRISIISGVSKVDVYGTKSAVRIKADPSALAARGMTVDDLAAAIRQGTSYQGAGQIDGPHRTFVLQPQGQLDRAESYNELIIGMRDGAPIYLKDVATARDSVQDERINMRFWVRGREVPPATVVLAVSRQAGSNAVEVAAAVKAVVPGIVAELPASVALIPIYDRSQTIVNSVEDVKETLVIAFGLVVVVIFMFLGRVTDTLIPVVALPLSLLLTFVAMKVLGYSLDNLSLMALTLAVGFLVDDAIVFLENTVRRMEKFHEQPARAALNSAKEITFTILSMTLALAAVFLPMVFMGGLVGRIFREFAVTIVVAIIASGIVSMTLTPLMCARLLGARGAGVRKTWVERVIGGVEKRVLAAYSGSLWFFLRHRWISACLWVGCLAGTGYLLSVIPRSFLPIGDSSFIFGLLIGQEGASPEQMHAHQEVVEAALRANESVETVVTVTGVSGFLAANQGIAFATLKPPSERPPVQMPGPDGRMWTLPHAPIALVAGQIMMAAGMQLQGAFAVMQPHPVLQISTGATASVGGQFAYALSGANPAEVYAVSEKLLAKLNEQRGRLFASVMSDLYRSTPNLRIEVLRDQAAGYGVTAAQIETLLRNAYSQNYVYLIKRTDDQYQVILEVADAVREQPEDLGLLYLRSQTTGDLVPLSAVARWSPAVGPQDVNHLNQFTSVTLNFNLVPGVPIGTATQFVEDAAREIVPAHLRGDFQGEAMTFRDTIRSLSILMVLAVFVMYVILAILYESYLHPITVLSTLPTALVGGLLTLHLFGQEASLYAFIGLFMLMGIVKKNGIMIVDFAVQRIALGETAERAIHDASIDRFRPIIMTTLAAVMGALPIALGWGADGASRRPLGLVVVGGLLVSQLITLYVTPVIYLYLEVFQEQVLNRIPFFAAHYEGHAEAAELERDHDADSDEEAAGGDGHERSATVQPARVL